MEATAKNVDRLVTIEIRTPKRIGRDTIAQLYDCAFQKLGGKPISLLAAQKLIDAVKPGDNVFLITGFCSWPNMPFGEDDGPLGVASLARAIKFGLGGMPIIVVGPGDMDPVCKTVRAAGLNVVEYARAKESKTGTAAAITFPIESKEDSKKFAAKIIEEYAPKAAISVETVGPNKKGVKHFGSGFDAEASDKLPGVEYVFTEASAKNILTIGVMDLGNELGCGTIEEDVRRLAKYADVCQCPCGGGSACAVKSDIIFPAAVSNWGAYAITAMIAYLLKKPELLQDTYTERRMLEACTTAGGIDGITGQTSMFVDGIDYIKGEALISLLHGIIETALKD